MLDSHGSHLRKVDAISLAYFAGLITVLVPLIIFFLAIKAEEIDEHYDQKQCWLSSMPVFRFTFMLTFLIFATGFDI